MQPWEESGGDGEMVLTFAGVNRDVADKIEMENFSRGLQKEDARGLSGRQMRRIHSWIALGVAFVVWLACDFFGMGFNSVYIAAGALVVTIIVLTKRQIDRDAPGKSVAAGSADNFRITVSPKALTVEGASLPRRSFDVGSVVGVEGGRDLTVRLSDRAERLPCSLAVRDHDALAARIQELVLSAKARGEYR